MNQNIIVIEIPPGHAYVCNVVIDGKIGLSQEFPELTKALDFANSTANILKIPDSFIYVSAQVLKVSAAQNAVLQISQGGVSVG